jgi:hypothetical protein
VENKPEAFPEKYPTAFSPVACPNSKVGKSGTWSGLMGPVKPTYTSKKKIRNRNSESFLRKFPKI